MNPIRVAQVGLGPIGQACVCALVQKPGIELIGGVDIDPSKVGLDVGNVCGLEQSLGLTVRDDLAAALSEWRPQVVLHTTRSFLDQVQDQLETIVRARANVVSSTEELFYPLPRDAALPERLDRLAQQHGVAVVGTGVNPGFAMDMLPLCLTAVCITVESIRVTRIVDAGRRRLPLQRKVGAGITVSEFESKLAAGQFGHIGLRESAYAVMATLGWAVEEIDETICPVLAEERLETPFLVVEPGRVAGVHQVLRAFSRGKERLVLDLRMAVGARGPVDSVEIEGDPPLSMRIEGGIFGDTATIGALVNTVPKVLDAKPGLRTMMELPLPHAFV